MQDENKIKEYIFEKLIKENPNRLIKDFEKRYGDWISTLEKYAKDEGFSTVRSYLRSKGFSFEKIKYPNYRISRKTEKLEYKLLFERNNLKAKMFTKTERGWEYSEYFSAGGYTGNFSILIKTNDIADVFNQKDNNVQIKGSKQGFGIHLCLRNSMSGIIKTEIHTHFAEVKFKCERTILGKHKRETIKGKNKNASYVRYTHTNVAKPYGGYR